MNLKKWLGSGELRPHEATRREIQDLFRLVDRDIRDAQTAGLSSDRQFLIGYEAALSLSTIVLYASGYETRGRGHHYRTFAALPEVMGEEFEDLAHYFEICRAKRNRSTYDRSGHISGTDVHELLKEVLGFRRQVVSWIHESHPHLGVDT